MTPVIDFKTNNKGQRSDFSISFLSETHMKIMLHALELYNVSQEDFLKGWNSSLKKKY